jgi:hypothetical protein
MAIGASNAILRQEAQGQRELVASEVLPTDMGGCKELLKALGVKFLEEVEGDPLFQRVQLPEGWKKSPSDHPMWSHLLDEKQRKRGTIFYKAAFYDRRAHMSMDRRFSVRQDYDQNDRNSIVYQVLDGEKAIFTTTISKITTHWLATKYPDWQNPAAYWD